MENKEGKETHSGSSSHYLSFQNFTLWPLPTKKKILLLKRSHSLLMDFQRPTPWPSLTSLKRHSPSFSPYFWLITCLQKALFSLEKHQLHLQRRALFIAERHLTLQPPFLFLEQTIFHLTKWGLCTRTPLHKRKSLWICSNLKLTSLGIQKSDMKKNRHTTKGTTNQCKSLTFWDVLSFPHG